MLFLLYFMHISFLHKIYTFRFSGYVHFVFPDIFRAYNTDNQLIIDTQAELSFWAHYELVTIHPWADGNGRTSRLLMNLLQMEYDVLPTKVFKEDKAEYIQALIDTREAEDTDIFINCMAKLHCEHLQQDIDQFLRSTAEEMVDKMAIQQELVGKWSIKPTLAGKLADIIEFMTDKEEIKTEHLVSELGLTETTAKRYLRQLTEFGYLEAHGGNRNKSYTKNDHQCSTQNIDSDINNF